VKIAYVLAASAGGTAAHVAMLARGCAARGMAVTVYGPAEAGRRFFAAMPAPGEAGSGEGSGGWPGFVPVEIADRPRPVRDAAEVLRLRGLLRRGQPDIVHAHGLRAGAVAALALTGRPRQRPALAVTVHNAPSASPAAAAVYVLLEWIVARRADAVTWVSDDLGDRMRRRRARNAGRALVPAPPAPVPSPAQVTRARDELGGTGPPVVLAAGRLIRQKGFAVLIAAAALWRHRNPAPVLAIAGEGPLAPALALQARSAGLAVHFLGQRDDVPALLAAADVVVVPSLWEGQPLFVQEALRAGKPVVAARTGGIPALTGEDGALLVPPGDAAALAGAVESVLDDPALAAKLAAAAAQRAAALPIAATAIDAAAALYHRLISVKS
jgi:glycosyltransferase involved in cell wall biosynthesis